MDKTPAGQLLSMRVQAHPWHGIPPHPDGTNLVNAFIEIVPADTVKYEIDKESGHLKIDRIQRFSSLCPTLYGFIPRTYCGTEVGTRCRARTNSPEKISGDGDPMDICVLTERTVAHGGFLCRAKVVGGLRMIDGSEADDKIVAVLEDDLAYGKFDDIAECPAGLIERLSHYFLSYKQFPVDPARKVRIAEVYGRDEALETIRLSITDYQGKFTPTG